MHTANQQGTLTYSAHNRPNTEEAQNIDAIGPQLPFDGHAADGWLQPRIGDLTPGSKSAIAALQRAVGELADADLDEIARAALVHVACVGN